MSLEGSEASNSLSNNGILKAADNAIKLPNCSRRTKQLTNRRIPYLVIYCKFNLPIAICFFFLFFFIFCIFLCFFLVFFVFFYYLRGCSWGGEWNCCCSSWLLLSKSGGRRVHFPRTRSNCGVVSQLAGDHQEHFIGDDCAWLYWLW